MSTPAGFLRLCFIGLSLSRAALAQGAGADYRPELFERTKLVYADTFDGPLNPQF